MGQQTESNSRHYLIGKHAFESRPIEVGLYLVSTPIGNLGDITIRALETLASVDIIACEDTRTSGVLMSRYGIKTKLTPYHEHNAQVAGPNLIKMVASGKSVALISDAGTPLISDPGFKLVQMAQTDNCKVIPIPGACAAITALTASGLPSDAFFFAGFLPTKAQAKSTRLQELSATPATLIFYESPRRVSDTLHAMCKIYGPTRRVAIGRELTKAYEEMRVDCLSELIAHYDNAPTPKGEIVICVEPAPPSVDNYSNSDLDAMLLNLSKTMPASKASGEAARMTGIAKRDLFDRLIALRQDENDTKSQ